MTWLRHSVLRDDATLHLDFAIPQRYSPARKSSKHNKPCQCLSWLIDKNDAPDGSNELIMVAHSIQLTADEIAEFVQGIHDSALVSGLTHTFYNYPARFSPLFARAAIMAFTQPGDLVIDPFMGGGTTLVEARALARSAIGIDISSLASFLSTVKTTILSENDAAVLYEWVIGIDERLNLRNVSIRATGWIEAGYQHNIDGKSTWPTRKTIELALAQVDQLPQERQRQFARCVLLKTAQWALDRRDEIPSAAIFREQFLKHFCEMIEGARRFADAAKSADLQIGLRDSLSSLCLHRSAMGIEQERRIQDKPAPKLILTSPPYPGVHVLYHRWQIHGRQETPAPFWIADCLDGSGGAFYTLGDRKQKELTTYFDQVQAAFTSLSQIADDHTWVVQMVAFSNSTWQLAKYLDAMAKAGFAEVKMPVFANSPDGRVWRSVPNRKWYARQQGETPSSKEVVLFHRLSQKQI